jgi:hypothetical protein
MLKRALFWAVWNVPLGRAAPWVLGLALGSRPRRVSVSETLETIKHEPPVQL